MNRTRRKTTKTLVGLAVVASGLAAPLATHDAEASYFTGAMCSVGTRGQHWTTSTSPAGSVQTTSGTTGLALRCAMPVNQQGGALSSTPFSFRVWRSSGSGSTFCAGDVYDHDGNNIFQSSFVSATNTANTFQWLTPAAGPAAADTYNFSAQCTIATNDKLVATRLGPDRTTSNKAHNPSMNISGSICRPTSSANENDFKYDDSRIANITNGYRDVICPVPADINLGAHLEWTFGMDDETTIGALTCLGVTIDTNDNVVYQTPAVSSSVSGVGFTNVTGTAGAFGPNLNWRHYASCSIPPVQNAALPSSIRSVRMF